MPTASLLAQAGPEFSTQALVVGLVAARLAGVVALAPLFGRRAVGWRIKIALLAALTMLAAPAQLQTLQARSFEADAVQWIAWFFREAGVGLAFGAGVFFIGSGIAAAGELMANAIGFDGPEGVGRVPNDPTDGPSLARLFELTAFAVLLASGGHRFVIDAILQSFQTLPIATAENVSWQSMLGIASHAFEFSIRAAAPVVSACVAAQLLLSLLAKAQPLLRDAGMQHSGRALAGTGVWLISLGVTGLLARGELQTVLRRVQSLLAGS